LDLFYPSLRQRKEASGRLVYIQDVVEPVIVLIFAEDEFEPPLNWLALTTNNRKEFFQ